MEHVFLNAGQLAGLIMVSGGAFLVLALLGPVKNLRMETAGAPIAVIFQESARRWVCWAGWVAGLATLADLFVQTAEARGSTPLGGLSWSTTLAFVWKTQVGQLSFIKGVVFLCIAVLAQQRIGRKIWIGLSGLAVGALVLSSLVSHAAAQPEARSAAIFFQVLHVAAVGVWIGVLMHLLAVRRHLEASDTGALIQFMAGMVRRFSPVAMGAVLLLAISGAYGLCRFLATPAALFTSAYGLTYTLKMLFLIPLLLAGYRNFRVHRPALQALARSDPDKDLPPSTENLTSSPAQGTRRKVLQDFFHSLEWETTLGLVVIVVAATLGSIPPPGSDPSLRLTSLQANALVTPHWPRTRVADPATFYGALYRTPEDLTFAEFTHNWAGVMVCALGACWLLQGFGGRVGRVAGLFWPALMLIMTFWVAIAADPEIWYLRVKGWRQAMSDPQLYEHQLCAGMVLVFAWFGWRDLRRPVVQRPLGYLLPGLLFVGGVFLLGHAHAVLTITRDLDNLINVQHAIMGSLGLIAATIRWLELRGLFPRDLARILWPSCIIGLGVFMAFFYREAV